MALEGAVDFSLVITPLFHPGTLTTIELYQERILIALSEKHRLAQQHPASPSEEFPVIDFHDLDREPFIKNQGRTADECAFPRALQDEPSITARGSRKRVHDCRRHTRERGARCGVNH